MEDISQGLEHFPIPCEAQCESGDYHRPDKFRYVRQSIPGPGCDREEFEKELCGCHCHGVCNTPTCHCLQRFGRSYDPDTRQLSADAVTSTSLKPLLECNSQCQCDASCPNRLVQHGPTVRLKVAPSGSRGFGLFAAEDIKQLTFVCEYAGEVLGVEEARKRLGKTESPMNYLIVLREHCSAGVILTCVDPVFMGNVGRFANHSCDPNLLMVPVRVDHSIPRLALFARRDVSAGEELTFDYSGETVLHSQKPPALCPSTGSCESAVDIQKRVRKERLTSCQTVTHEEEDKVLNCDRDETLLADYVKAQDSETDGINCKAKLMPSLTESHNLACFPAVSLQGDLHSASDSRTPECGKPTTHQNLALCNQELTEKKYMENETTASYTCGNLLRTTRKRTFPFYPGDNSGVKDTTTGRAVGEKQEGDNLKWDRKTIAAAQKRCLCGALKCRGYLPFDGSIFASS